MLSTDNLLKQFKKHKASAEAALGKQQEHIREARSFYDGSVMNYRDEIVLGNKRKKHVVQFNEVKPYVMSVAGFMAQNRRKAKFIARVKGSEDQQLYSQYMNAYHDYMRDAANADNVETACDISFLTQGISAVETAMTYSDGFASDEPAGNASMGELDILDCWWDMSARSPNLIDAKYCAYRKRYELKDAIALFDNAKEEDFQDGGDGGIATGIPTFNEQGRYEIIKNAADIVDDDAETVSVTFYQWYQVEDYFRAENPVYLFVNPEAANAMFAEMESLAQDKEDSYLDQFAFNPRDKIITFDKEVKKQLEEMFGDLIKVYKYTRKVYYTAVISGDHVFTHYKNLHQNGFTVKFKTGDFNKTDKIWVGMVAPMMEPQKYKNIALSNMLYSIAAAAKGGVMYEEGAIEDIRAFEENYTRTDGNVQVSSGAIAEGRIKPKREGYAPSGYENVVQISSDVLRNSSGIDRAFLGSTESAQETAQLNRQRVKQVVTTMAVFFDSLTLYQKEHAKLMSDYIRVHADNNEGNLFRIIGQDGAVRFEEISKARLVNSYDIVVDEAPTSAQEKIEKATILSNIGDKLLAIGDTTGKKIYALSLQYLGLDYEDMQQVSQVLTGDQETKIDPMYVQLLEKQVAQLTSDVEAAKTKKTLSEVALNAARVAEMSVTSGKTQAETVRTLNEAAMAGLQNRTQPTTEETNGLQS